MTPPKLKKTVQFATRFETTFGACSVCRALVASQDQEGHRKWHNDNQETTR